MSCGSDDPLVKVIHMRRKKMDQIHRSKSRAKEHLLERVKDYREAFSISFNTEEKPTKLELGVKSIRKFSFFGEN